jgi:hypothetical protein
MDDEDTNIILAIMVLLFICLLFAGGYRLDSQEFMYGTNL